MTSVSTPPTPPVRPPSRAAWKYLLLALALLLVLTVLLVLAVGGALALLADQAIDQESKQDAKCCWEKHATAASVSERLGVHIPASATDQRAGVKQNSRNTIALLAFSLPTRDADAYLAQLLPEDWTMEPPDGIGGAAPVEASSSFRHLGLPEPGTAGPESDVRAVVGLCPDSLGGAAKSDTLKRCIDLYRRPVTGPGDQTWLYFRSQVAGQ